MLKIGLIISVMAIALSCTGPAVNETPDAVRAEQKTEKDGVFIHISHGADDPHRVCMALNMAVMMAQEKDVLVYFDIKGIEAVLKDAPDITYPTFPGSKEQLTKLYDMGIGVYACPGCLKAAGKSGEDLMQGIQVAQKERFFDFTKGRILSLDY
ncbi:MAG: DsrE family protein [Bacteroidales bacterium]|nr:DsrE family protein [Bacteroidales bacterium]